MSPRSGWTAGVLGLGVAGALLWGLAHPRWDRSASPPAPTPAPFLPEVAPRLSEGLVELEAVLMGSDFTFKVEGEREPATRALRAALERVRGLEEEISEWRPGSDISRLNRAAGIEPVKVGKDTFQLLSQARQVHALTEGAFDVTIGPVWDLWGFRDPKRPEPTRTQIQQTLELVNAARIELHEEGQTAYLPREGMRVNLGGIGKGYAARAATDAMRPFGIQRAAVSAGGDLYLLGHRSSGPWIVGVENPLWPDQMIERFEAGDVGVATSGDLRRRIEHAGKSYGHILDPRTGYPAEGCHSVTVISVDPTLADAYATAIFVMGAERGLAWAERQDGVETMIMDSQGQVTRSSGWRQLARPHQVESSRPQPAPSAGPSLTQRSTPEGGAQAVPGRRPDLEAGPMVWVPGGWYRSGEASGRVWVEGFSIDRTEVTNLQYARFLKAGGHRFCHPQEPPGKDHRPRYWRDFRPRLFRLGGAAALAPFNERTLSQPDRPVVGVDWWDAVAFSRWAGKRLPTRQEWETAAGGKSGWQWPWGNRWDPARANTGGEMHAERDGFVYAAPADSFPRGAAACGALHMAGNVAEWTQEGAAAGGSSASNPSQVRARAGQLRAPGFRSFDLGFRCAAP